ncbi:hypothetical protein V8G54_001074 [Vigna mungo]|uniref:Homoserine dehydrogenase n=1 Tax=Vigna mungo TaxID=3915 RepID=A0AAQ3P6F3_VIGMU
MHCRSLLHTVVICHHPPLSTVVASSIGQVEDLLVLETSNASILKEEFNIDLRVMGILGSKSMLLSDAGINLTRWRELREERGEAADLEKFVQHVHGNNFIPNTALVDCTADSVIAGYYYEWLRKGIHVVTPNKKANSGPLEQVKNCTLSFGWVVSIIDLSHVINAVEELTTYEGTDTPGQTTVPANASEVQNTKGLTKYLRLRALQRQSYTHYFYEATVGAGLPIVSTLRGLLETGDRILQIEGIFSGTLSYIFNNFKDGRAFSEVVAEAKEAGYTEPDPRDDLSGTDVARKVIILARESGLKLELSNIPVESLVPEPLQVCASAQEFMQELPKFDQVFTKKQEDAENAGEVLRYVGVVDVINRKGVVELRRYKKDHPFAQLSGSDNIIAFTTRRYKDQPLIVRGPGAGAQVTAGGIFSDILRLASYLGAPS